MAGAPGSGKSSLLPVAHLEHDAFNADDIAAELNGNSYIAIPSSIREIVNRRLEAFIRNHTRDGISFAVETALRSAIALEQAERARMAGFYTTMSYIATADEQINLDRVALRSEGGGHSAPKDTLLDIRRKSLANLTIAIQSAGTALDDLSVFDNSVNGKYMTRAFTLRYSLTHDSLSIEREDLPRYLEPYYAHAAGRAI